MKSLQSARYQEFVKRLRAARLEVGLTQVEVAACLDRHQSWVSKCESGERRVDPVELLDFCHLYKKPVEYFLQGLAE